MSLARREAVRSSISSGRTRIRTSRPAWTANERSTPLKLSAEVFAYFIRNTAFAITNEQSRFTLSGAKFIVGDGTAKMVTTDGHRLAYVEKKIDDLTATRLARDIVKKIEEQLTYPGQIKVTVIRETRAVEYAK